MLTPMTDALLRGCLRSRFSALLASLLIAGPILSATDTAAPATPAVHSQSPVGKYELLKEDGSPVVPGWKIVSIVTQPLWPVPIYVINDTIDKGDGNGPQPATGERSMLVPDPNTPGSYLWENERGTTGTLTPESGGYESEVTSGPNTGTKRKMKRMS